MKIVLTNLVLANAAFTAKLTASQRFPERREIREKDTAVGNRIQCERD